jgi:hypothetical protein
LEEVKEYGALIEGKSLKVFLLGEMHEKVVFESRFSLPGNFAL